MGHNLPFDRDVNYPVSGPGATTANVNARRPYAPGVLGRVLLIESVLGNDYHGLQLVAEKRIGRRFQAQGSYVFGKSLEDAQLQMADARPGAQDMNDLAAERAHGQRPPPRREGLRHRPHRLLRPPLEAVAERDPGRLDAFHHLHLA